MNILKKLFPVIPVVLLLFSVGVILPSKAEAAEFHFKSFTLSQEESVNEDVYAVGDTITIDGVIDGDLIAFADVIQVNGTITGDVYLVGSKVDVNANIYGNTVVLGNNTTLEGLLVQNVYIASSFLNYSAETEKDALAFCMEGNIKGSVGDDLRMAGARTTIDSVVRGDLIVLGDESSVSEEKVTGSIYYNSTLESIAKEQGVDTDTIFKVETPVLDNNWNLKIFTTLISFFATCLVGFVIITLTPVKTITITNKITGSTDEFLKSLALGLVITLLIPFPLFLLFISIVGTPLAILITGILLFMVLFGKIWVETAFGKEILELFGVKEYRPFKSFLVGRVLSAIVSFIPVVRTFYSSILILVALGAVVRMKKDYYAIAKEQAKPVVKKSVKKKK